MGTRPMTRRFQAFLPAPVLAAMLAVCSATVAAPPVIVSGYHGHAESGKTPSPLWQRAKTYAWAKGVPARDPSVEAQLHATIDTLLAEKGWELTEETADVYLKTATERLTAVSIGVLRIDVTEGPSKQLAWRSLITDIVASKREKFGRLLDKTLKKAFKPFPRVKS